MCEEVFPQKKQINDSAPGPEREPRGIVAFSTTISWVSTEVQTMADLGEAPSAMRTPLYLILSAVGLLMIVGTFLTWASVNVGEGDVAASASGSGMQAGGWGLSALICGAAIVALGIIGYFVNPFSDPEAMFITAIGAAVTVAALLKIGDSQSLFAGEAIFEFHDAGSSAGIGLWLVLLAGLDAFLGGIWILISRPRAEARLS